MKEEKKFEKIIEWQDGYSYLVLILWIIISPLLATILFIQTVYEKHNELRKVYWREIK